MLGWRIVLLVSAELPGSRSCRRPYVSQLREQPLIANNTLLNSK